MIKVDTTRIKHYERRLERLNKRGIAYATRQTLNDGAFAARRAAVEIVEDKFITRNKWTTKTINVEKTKSLVIGRQRALVGSTQEYMERQEFGGMNPDTIATSAASGEGRSRVRRRAVRRSNRNKFLRVARRARSIPVQGRIRMAIKDKTRTILVERGEGITPGVYRIQGGTARNPARGRLNLIQAHPQVPTRTKRNPWLSPAVAKTQPKMAGLYAKNIAYQLNRTR